MPDCGNRRDWTIGNPADEAFVVEGPQVLDGPSSSGKNDEVDPWEGKGFFKGPNQGCRRILALHLRIKNKYGAIPASSFQNAQEILQGGSAQGGDNCKVAG